MAEIPYLGMTLEELAARRRAFDMAKAALAQRQSSLFGEAGLAPQFDAGGKLTGVTQDGSNLTGAYHQLRRGEVDELEALEEDQAQRGFKGGLLQQDEDRLRYAQSVQDAQFMRSLMDQFGALSGERQGLEFDYNEDVRNIWRNAAQQAIQNRDFTPVVVPPRQAPRRKPRTIGPAQEARERIPRRRRRNRGRRRR